MTVNTSGVCPQRGNTGGATQSQTDIHQPAVGRRQPGEGSVQGVRRQYEHRDQFVAPAGGPCGCSHERGIFQSLL